jgi:sugar transferase (PEP-CTERM/EpsH1 system associated)
LNVLFLAQRVPYPPDRGDRITTWHVLRHLASRAERVRVACLSEAGDPGDAAAVRELEERVGPVCAPRVDRRWRRLASLRGLVTGAALTLPFFRVRALARGVERWLAADPPDVVWVYSSSMAQYVLGWRPPPGTLRVMQFAELDSDKWRQFAERRRGLGRWIYAREARELLAFETRVARTFEVSAVVSEVERDLFQRSIPGVVPVVLPNGVDVDHFRSAGERQREPATVIFTGVLDYEPNVAGVLWFARECWPRVRAAMPAARLLVVGSRPVAAIRGLDGRDGVTVTGRVPATPPWFDRARVAIAPLHVARGVQNKVLEALSMGLPVVCTAAAAQGLGQEAQPLLEVADDPAGFAAAVGRLLAAPAAAAAAGARGAEWVRAHCRWEHVHERIDALLAGARAPP